jgi:hypothetical protein
MCPESDFANMLARERDDPARTINGELNHALDGVIHLERCLAIADPDQLKELMNVKRHILNVFELEGQREKKESKETGRSL